VGSGEYSVPQVTAELLDQQCGVPASSKRDVKADSMTPASLARGCLDPTMFGSGLGSEVLEHGLAAGAKLCPLQTFPRFWDPDGRSANPDSNFEIVDQ
jgi:hypothetical protein